MDETLRRLLNDYHDALISQGYGMRRKELKQKDRIDIRPLTNPTKLPSDLTCIKSEYYERIKARNNITIFDIVPCFKEGVLQINRDRYMHWILKDVDSDAQTLDIFLQDYSKLGGSWSIGVSGTARYYAHKQAEQFQVRTTLETQYCYSDIYTMINLNILPWSKQDKAVWENIVLTNARKTEEKLSEKGTTNFLQLAKVYTLYMQVINYILSQHKPKAIRTPVSTRSASAIRTEVGEPKEQPLVKKRRVGLLEIQSATIPRLPNQQTLRTYRLPSWKTRGHIRTYKSGKQVYIKESVHRRKHLNPDGQTQVPRTEITLRGQKRRPS